MNPAHMFRQTITVKPLSGRSSYGDPTFGAARTQKARVEAQNRLVKKGNGEEVVSSTVLYTATAIGETDRVWLPGTNTSDASQARVPLAVKPEVDGTGKTIFYRVDLG